MSAESRASRLMARLGLRLTDFAADERFAAIAWYGYDVDLAAIKSYIDADKHWAHPAAAKKRAELRQLHRDASRYYERGETQLAVTTARLLHAEARWIGMRVAANPVMVKHKQAQERGKSVNAAAAARKNAATAQRTTPDKIESAKDRLRKRHGEDVRITQKMLADELFVSTKTLRRKMKRTI